MGEKDSGVLSYAAEAELVAAPWHVSSRFGRIPSVVLALGVLVFLHSVLYFGLDRFAVRDVFDRLAIYSIVAAAAPVLFQRRGWRSLTLAIGIIVALSAIRLIGFFTYKFSANGYIETFAPAALLTLLVACLWILPTRLDKARVVVDVCVLSITVGVVMIALNNFFWYWDGYDPPLFGRRGGEGFAYSHILLPYGLILMLWIGIRFIGRDRGIFRSALLVTYYLWFAVTIAGSVFYIFFLSVLIAGYSFDTGFPFDRAASANTMVYYGAPNARFWHAFDRAEWDRYPSVMGPGADWRDIAIHYLVLHDRGAPKRLAGMLVTHPKHEFADAIADDVAKAGVYDAMPIFLRYALATHSDKCTEAILTFGVRQGAWVVFFNAIQGSSQMGHSGWFSPAQRSALAALLGTDAGDNPDRWESLLREKASGPKPPIPATVTSEADEVIQIFLDYRSANWALRRRQGERLIQLAAAEGLSAELQKVLRHELTGADDFNPSIQEVLRLFKQAEAEVHVRDPDWDAPDTSSLRREVEAYKRLVAGLPVLAAPPKKIFRAEGGESLGTGVLEPPLPAPTQPFRFLKSGASTQNRAE
jgi:hypothetical protein